MLDLHDRLRRKDEEVVAKVMDGEAIIINLSNGIYYSLDNVGAAIWDMIEGGWRLDEIVTAIASRYDVAGPRAEHDVLRLVTELLGEDVVVIAEPNGASSHQPAASVAQKLPYASPELHAYRDMEDLLALDPPTPSLADIPWKA